MVAPLSTQLQSAPVCLLVAVMKLNCVGVLLTAVTSSYNKYKNHQRARRNWKNACKTTKTFPNNWTLLQIVLLLPSSVTGQGTCESDDDCTESQPCCSGSVLSTATTPSEKLLQSSI